MKPFIYFDPKNNYSFEGARLRKNLKGALEVSGNGWVSSLFASPDVLHVISPYDENKAHDAVEEGVKLVVSAFFVEDDPLCRFLEDDKKKGLVLKKNAERLIRCADLVIVPNQSAKDFLGTLAINPNVKVLSAGVNLARFEKNDPIEGVVFSRYVSIASNQKFFFTVGDYDDIDSLKALNEVAGLLPSYKFYFAGIDKHGRLSNGARSRMKKIYTPNLNLLDLLDDDIYRSAMMNTFGYISLGCSHPDYLTALEAMAARRQVFSLGPKAMEDVVIDKKTGYVADSTDKLAKMLQSWCAKKLQSTIIEGYKTAKASSLLSVGKGLEGLYEELIKEDDQI